MEPSSMNVGFSHGVEEKASTRQFVATELPVTSISLDMKPISKKANALASSYDDGVPPVLDSEDKETLAPNVSGDMNAVPEVEESFAKASPGSGYGEMQVESSVLVSAEVVNKEQQHEREGECSSKTQEVGETEREKAAGAEKEEVEEAERKKEPGAEKKEVSLHPGKQDELQIPSTSQTVEQKQEVESFSVQSPIAIEQNQAKQEVEPFSDQSPIAIDQNQEKQEVESFSTQSTTETKKQVSNSTAQNGLLERSSKSLGGSKGGIRGDVSVKPSWSKANSDFKVNSKPEFTMEAMAWPTLAEARDRKPSKHDMPVPKPASSKVEDFTPPSMGSRKPPQFQRPLSENPRHGVNALPASKYYKRGHMMGKLNFPASENLPLPPVQNSPNAIRKDNEHRGMKESVPSSQWVSGNFHNQAWRSPDPINTAYRHNSMHASGRGHPGWHRADTSYGYGQGHFNCLPPHGFNVASMYPQPVYNSNPAFYNIPNFQMLHGPAGFHNGPPGPPKGIHNIFGPVSTEGSIRRQIEYYFSNENLRKDKYLKSLMDGEGFVPVSLIARFNRMHKLTSSHLVILEALKTSSVVEVKGDKIRRARDWREFLSSLSERRLTEGTCQTPITQTTGFQNNEDSCPAHERWTEDENSNADGDLIISPKSCEPSSASLLNNDPLVDGDLISSPNSCEPSSASVVNHDPALVPKTIAEPDNTSRSSLQSQEKTKDSMEINERRFVEDLLSSYIAVL